MKDLMKYEGDLPALIGLLGNVILCYFWFLIVISLLFLTLYFQFFLDIVSHDYLGEE